MCWYCVIYFHFQIDVVRFSRSHSTDLNDAQFRSVQRLFWPACPNDGCASVNAVWRFQCRFEPVDSHRLARSPLSSIDGRYRGRFVLNHVLALHLWLHSVDFFFLLFGKKWMNVAFLLQVFKDVKTILEKEGWLCWCQFITFICWFFFFLTNSKYTLTLSNHLTFYFCLRFNFPSLINGARFRCAACVSVCVCVCAQLRDRCVQRVWIQNSLRHNFSL